MATSLHAWRDGRSTANPDAAPIEFSDDALALEFSQRHGDDLRYTAAWGRWTCWNGHAWEADETRRVLDLARDCCRADERIVPGPETGAAYCVRSNDCGCRASGAG